MGRTNLVILAFGIFACVALSLMMGHAVKIKDKKAVHPAVFELHSVFGEQIRRRPVLKVVERGGTKVAVLTVHPRVKESADRLARAMGRYLSRFRGLDLRFDKLEVNMRAEDGSDTIVPIHVSGSVLPSRSVTVRIPKSRPRGASKPNSKAAVPAPPETSKSAAPVKTPAPSGATKSAAPSTTKPSRPPK